MPIECAGCLLECLANTFRNSASLLAAAKISINSPSCSHSSPMDVTGPDSVREVGARLLARVPLWLPQMLSTLLILSMLLLLLCDGAVTALWLRHTPPTKLRFSSGRTGCLLMACALILPWASAGVVGWPIATFVAWHVRGAWSQRESQRAAGLIDDSNDSCNGVRGDPHGPTPRRTSFPQIAAWGWPHRDCHGCGTHGMLRFVDD